MQPIAHVGGWGFFSFLADTSLGAVGRWDTGVLWETEAPK